MRTTYRIANEFAQDGNEYDMEDKQLATVNFCKIICACLVSQWCVLCLKVMYNCL